MSFFRPFYDTSFNDHRQVRIVVQDLTKENAEQSSSLDFQRFFTYLNAHKQNTFEQFKLEYCFVDSNLPRFEQTLSKIQFYRQSFASIFFAVCQTTDELRSIFNRYAKAKSISPNVFTHLFIRYRSTQTLDDDDDESLNGNQDDLEFIQSHRSSVISTISLESTRSSPAGLPTVKTLESLPSDENETAGSESTSLSNSLNFSSIDTNDGNETINEQSLSEPVAAILTNLPATPSPEPKKTRAPFIRQKTLPSTPIFDSYESELNRAYHRLETALKKTSLDSRRSETNFVSIDSQAADIRLMIECEKDCSFFEIPRRAAPGRLKNVMSDCDQYIFKLIFENYINASTILTQENGKTKLPKKILEARTIKRKADCCLLLGSTERAYQEYRRAAEALKSQNDSLWSGAALEGRVAASYVSVQKPKRQSQKTFSFLTQNSLTKRLSMAKLLTRSNTPINLNDKIENALQIYNTTNRTSSNKFDFQFELDACIRWCSLLMEQTELSKYRETIEGFINQISKLGANIENPLYTIYLNAFVAESFTFIGMKRKGALFYRSAAYAGLSLLEEEEEEHREISFFDSLIKNARIGYGIEDDQLIFPLIQKTVLNESIQICLKRNDHTTILKNVHFAIESLMEYLDDVELEGLLTFLNIGEQTINCSYCSMPRLKSLNLLPLSDRLKPLKIEAKNNIFLYRPPILMPSHQKSLHRKVDFLWIRNQPVQIALIVENSLPAPMIIKQIEFLSDIALETKIDKKYSISARTTKQILVDCVPKETGRLKIQGLRFRLWSTLQEFQFADFFSIRHCSCSVDVVYELPIVDIENLSVNQQPIRLNPNENHFVAQIHRGENVQLSFDLINSSADYPIESLNIDVYVSCFNLTYLAKKNDFSLPLLFNQRIPIEIDVTGVCERRLSRSSSNIESLTMEIRINYTNGDLSSGEGFYRRETIEIRWNFLPSIHFELEKVEQDDDETKFLIVAKVENLFDEQISFDEQTIEPHQTSFISTKQNKIQFEHFPSNLDELIASIRNLLPTFLHYQIVRTANEREKRLRVPIDWSSFSSSKLEENVKYLIHCPFRSFWQFYRENRTIEIFLGVESQTSSLNKIEFSFVKTTDFYFLNSSKILFNDVRPSEFHRDQRRLLLVEQNQLDVLAVDVKINEIFWRRITLTIE